MTVDPCVAERQVGRHIWEVGGGANDLIAVHDPHLHAGWELAAEGELAAVLRPALEIMTRIEQADRVVEPVLLARNQEALQGEVEDRGHDHQQERRLQRDRERHTPADGHGTRYPRPRTLWMASSASFLRR